MVHPSSLPPVADVVTLPEESRARAMNKAGMGIQFPPPRCPRKLEGYPPSTDRMRGGVAEVAKEWTAESAVRLRDPQFIDVPESFAGGIVPAATTA
jgi:hypothetical protein